VEISAAEILEGVQCVVKPGSDPPFILLTL